MEYNEIVLGGISSIHRMIKDHAEESHKIDFKQKTYCDRIELSREDKKVIGEAVSGFANADGGILGSVDKSSVGIPKTVIG